MKVDASTIKVKAKWKFLITSMWFAKSDRTNTWACEVARVLQQIEGEFYNNSEILSQATSDTLDN